MTIQQDSSNTGTEAGGRTSSVLVAPQGYHKRMYDMCQSYGMLYIVC